MSVRPLVLTMLLLPACRREMPLLTPPPPPAAPNVAAPSEQPSEQPSAQPPSPGRPPGEQERAIREPARPANQQIRASHVLVMHRDSQRVPPGITRSRDEARTRAQDVLRRARSGTDFAALAREFSDEPGAQRTAGDLSRFERGSMVPPFEQAAFALSVGQISDVVETPFGFHIIKRTE